MSQKLGRLNCHGPCFTHLALLLEVPSSLRLSGSSDAAGLLQGLVEPCDVLLHFLQRSQQHLGLLQQGHGPVAHLRGRKSDETGHRREVRSDKEKKEGSLESVRIRGWLRVFLSMMNIHFTEAPYKNLRCCLILFLFMIKQVVNIATCTEGLITYKMEK